MVPEMGIGQAATAVIVRGERLQRAAAAEVVFGVSVECP